MGHNWIRHAMHALTNGASHEIQHGNKSRGAGLGMIVFGLLLLPIPFIGIPLIIIGICQSVSS